MVRTGRFGALEGGAQMARDGESLLTVALEAGTHNLRAGLWDVGPLTRVRARAEGETHPPGGESQPYRSRPRRTAVKAARRGTPGGFTAKAAGLSNRGEGWTMRDDTATGNGAVYPPVVSGIGIGAGNSVDIRPIHTGSG